MDNRISTYFFLAVLLGVLALTYFIFQPFLTPLLLALIFAVLLHPVYVRVSHVFGGRNSLAALATVLGGGILLFVPTFVLSTQLFSEAQQVYGSLAQNNGASITRTFQLIAPIADKYIPGSGARVLEFSASLDTYSRDALTWLIQHMGTAFSSVAALVLDLFLFFIALYYLLRDGEGLRTKLIELSPLNDIDDVTISNRLALAVHSVVLGRLAVALIQGALTGIGFALFGVPNPLLWGLVAAIAALIPSIGTALVIAPAVLYLAIVGEVGMAIGLSIWGAVAVGTIDNILAPYLMSSGTQVHPLLVLLSLLGGAVIFGPIGIFLGPLTVSLLLVLLSLYSEMSRQIPVSRQMGN